MATPPKTSAGNLHGILLIDKERGWTSHDVVARTRGITHQRKIGHTGTLDPMATGLLVLCLGDATRLIEYMTIHDKRYEGEITLGAATDTDDADGSVISTAAVPRLTADDLTGIASRFVGEHMQRPPAYSAISVGGRRAYAVARGGGTPELAERAVVVHDLELSHLQPNRLSIRLHCGSGTYVRSIARDIGETPGLRGAPFRAAPNASRRLRAGRGRIAWQTSNGWRTPGNLRTFFFRPTKELLRSMPPS